MLAIFDANPDTLDAFLLVAAILFVIGAVFAASRNLFESTIICAGLTAVSIGLMFLT